MSHPFSVIVWLTFAATPFVAFLANFEAFFLTAFVAPFLDAFSDGHEDVFDHTRPFVFETIVASALVKKLCPLARVIHHLILKKTLFFFSHDVQRHVNSVVVNDVVLPVYDSNYDGVNLRFVHSMPLELKRFFFERLTDPTVSDRQAAQHFASRIVRCSCDRIAVKKIPTNPLVWKRFSGEIRCIFQNFLVFNQTCKLSISDIIVLHQNHNPVDDEVEIQIEKMLFLFVIRIHKPRLCLQKLFDVVVILHSMRESQILPGL